MTSSSEEGTPPPCFISPHSLMTSAKRNSNLLIQVDEEDLLRKSFKQLQQQHRDASISTCSSPGTPTKRSGVKSSDFRGVSKCAKDGRWQSRIRVGKKVKYLGRFKTEVAAALKYDEAALALHGRRSTLNFELSEDQLAYSLAHSMEKRIELGLMDAATPPPPPPLSTLSRRRSTSPIPTAAVVMTTTNKDENDNDDEEENEEEVEEEIEREEEVTHADQNAAVCLMWMKLTV